MINECRAIILDYGLVLCHKPTSHQVERIAGVFGINHDFFWDLYEQNRAAYDRGDLTPAEYWSHFAKRTNVELNDSMLSNLRSWDIQMWSSVNWSLIKWVERLGLQGYKTAILSNMHLEFVTHIRKHCAWLNTFDCHIFSSEVRVVKPDTAIFYRCLEKLQVKKDQALFIDDRQINVEASRSIGMYALQFDSVSNLTAELRTMGFSILPATT